MGWNLVNKLAEGLSFGLFAPRCVLCDGAGDRGLDLCAACFAEFKSNPTCCQCCALPLPQNAVHCGACITHAPKFDSTFAPFVYGHPLDRLVQGFKFSARLDHGKVVSQVLVKSLQDSAWLQNILRTHSPVRIVPVPLHLERLRERGFNQALELARAITKSIDNAKLQSESLQRIRATQAQSGLEAMQRKRNVRHAFAASDDVKGQHILLIDDVITTAATVRECARVLKRAGAARVDVIAFARAPMRG